MSKYKNVPTELDGVKFASKREARRYADLKLLERAGEIKALRLQPRYPLTVNGEKIGEYRGDFAYHDCKSQQAVCEDVKGVETPIFKWKRRHFEIQYGIKITVTK